MPVFQIQHTTQYDYDYPVWESANSIKLYPRTQEGQEILSQQVQLSDKEARIETYKDYFGNTVGVFNILANHQTLIIDSVLTVRIPTRTVGTDPGDRGDWARMNAAKQEQILLLDLARPDVLLEKGQAVLADCFSGDQTPFEAVMSSMAYVFERFQYIKGITDVETTLEEVLSLGSGVCQDFAHVQLYLLRSRGIPARYVSGYICPNKNGLRGEGATHAWVEAWLPDRGWVGVDPTNNVLVSDTHVTLSVGRNFKDCTPVKGVFKGGASHALSVYVSVGYEDGYVSSDHNALKANKIIVSTETTDHVQQQQQQ